MQRLVGYALNGKTNEKALPICHGPGDGGKSTLLNTINAMVGDYGLQASNDLLTGRSSHPTEVADLYGRRYVTNIETEEGRRLKESLVKQLTGGDRISARRMREDPWNFWPTHTLFMATNHRPEIRGTDNAIWNRVKIVPFTSPVPKHKQDRELADKLRNELPGILAWAVRGHMEWLQNGLQEPDEVKAATDSYRMDMDVLARFIDEECDTGAGCKVKTSLLYGRYKIWCEESGEQVMRSQDFSQSLQERGYSRGKSDGTRIYKGIQPSTNGSGTHGSDEIGNTQENLSRGIEQNHVPSSDPDWIPPVLLDFLRANPDGTAEDFNATHKEQVNPEVFTQARGMVGVEWEEEHCEEKDLAGVVRDKPHERTMLADGPQVAENSDTVRLDPDYPGYHDCNGEPVFPDDSDPEELEQIADAMRLYLMYHAPIDPYDAGFWAKELFEKGYGAFSEESVAGALQEHGDDL